MKKCFSCGEVYSGSNSDCPSCGAHPEIREGIPMYAPALAQEGGGFRAEYFADLFKLEDGHFWFSARNRLINWALAKYCPGFHSFIEIGCGTGYVLSGVAGAFPGAQLHGSEIFVAALRYAAARQPTIAFMQMDARNIPFDEEFDAIGAFDVLEHIEQDKQVLVQMHRALKATGIIVLTVPQHPWLWSSVDSHSFHVRRYSNHEIQAKVRAAGFTITYSTSFITTLLPVMLFARLAKKREGKNGFDATAELKIPPRLNRIFRFILKCEFWMIRAGINFPVGGSRLVVARKS